MPDLITRLYQQFDPVKALGAHEDSLYVDWQARTGIEDIKRTAVRSVLLAGDSPTWTLVTGHRGAGKTTELVRMQAQLESASGAERHFVSFLHGQQWLDLEDVRAEDIVFQIVRQLVTDLKDHAPGIFRGEEIREWGKDFAQWFKTLGLDLGGDWFGISFTLKDFPSHRDDFRDFLRGQLPNLIDRVNERLIRPAKAHLAREGIRGGIVVIADDLDKIPPRVLSDTQHLTNQEQIFVHESQLLRALDCDAIYSIPIELAYSHAQNDLANTYGARPLHLPIIALADRARSPLPAGRGALRDIYDRRVTAAGAAHERIFADEALLNELLHSSGGHVRSLCIAIREVLRDASRLPLGTDEVRRALKRLHRDMRRGLEAGDAELVRAVADSGEESDEPAFFRLLRSSYVLAYQDDESDWYAPHPWLSVGGG